MRSMLKFSIRSFSPEAAAKAQDAIDVFKAAYQDYKTYAWGNDSLAPISKAPVNGA